MTECVVVIAAVAILVKQCRSASLRLTPQTRSHVKSTRLKLPQPLTEDLCYSYSELLRDGGCARYEPPPPQCAAPTQEHGAEEGGSAFLLHGCPLWGWVINAI
eukprot:43207-Eustigmatos_ZCMA.PRE.1